MPAPAPVPQSSRKPAVLAGALLGTLTLVFFMVILLMTMFNHPIPESGRFIVVIILSVGSAMSFSFIGGRAAANGRLPLFKNSPIQFAVGGGVAVFVIALLLGWKMYVASAMVATGKVPTKVQQSTSGAGTLGTSVLGRVYALRGQLTLAAQELEKSASNYRELQKHSKDAWAIPSASNLMGLALIYSQIGNGQKARETQEEYCENVRRMANANLKDFGIEAARGFDVLWSMDIKLNDVPRALVALKQAIELYRGLLQYHQEFDIPLAADLQETALIYLDKKDFERSERSAAEAIEILRRRARMSPGKPFGDALALSLLAEAWNLESLDPDRACGPMEQAEREATGEILRTIARTEGDACRRHIQEMTQHKSQ